VSAQDTNEIRELPTTELELVTGGSIAHDVTTAVKLVGAAAIIIYSAAWGLTGNAAPDPWG
jgi:hypothetical protein